VLFFIIYRVDDFPNSFAYVDFATPDAKLVAITLSERNLEGRRLLIKDGVLFFQGLFHLFFVADIGGVDY